MQRFPQFREGNCYPGPLILLPEAAILKRWRTSISRFVVHTSAQQSSHPRKNSGPHKSQLHFDEQNHLLCPSLLRHPSRVVPSLRSPRPSQRQ
ncbi:hypothetical protein LMH87_006290 [Akanthomyces muscarius]|uniref:Uncharacterized protein n=1 Tax=Akanthomyces muscarius TaxID=2231603 RepID=A0A9W8QMF2_AKAMU|nr:hypothetical protein LMH87_006290 [Akanthomyces muscarius]KAJ4164626.1 hypothetical protein LMH87_006290 [Akanthomyces muscarius]